MQFFKKTKKYRKNVKKMLDKSKRYAIILKCVIIVFFFGGFLPFFQGAFVKMNKNPEVKYAFCPMTA